MTERTLPDGEVEKTTYGTEMGALWRDDAEERLVRFDNYESTEHDDYEVEVYWLDPDEHDHRDSDVVSERQRWDDPEIEAFTDPDNEETAWLSGHNLPGIGAYGVFTTDAGPNCPVCGKFMTPGTPERHPPSKGSLSALGYTCNDYSWDHEGFMRQSEAIEKGYYFTIEDYLTARYGGEQA